MEAGMEIRRPADTWKTLYCVYVLSDPVGGAPRYVGSTNDAKDRYLSHLQESRSGTSRKDEWVRSILLRGDFPVMRVLAVGDYRDMVGIEQKLYDEHRDKLLNGSRPQTKSHIGRLRDKRNSAKYYVCGERRPNSDRVVLTK